MDTPLSAHQPGCSVQESSTSSETQTKSQPMDVSSLSAMFTALDIEVQTPSDDFRPDPDDCTVLDVDGTPVLVITDYANLLVKALFGKNHSSNMELKHRPHSVSKLTDTKVAVCYWQHNQITVLKITPDIEHDKNVIVHKNYNCVAPLGKGRLAVGCSDERVVDIINMSGKLLKTFDTPRSGYNVIHKPRSMCVTKEGDIVVTDGGSRSVYQMTQKGDILFHYAPDDPERRLEWPRGVAITAHGNILFADCYRDKVIQLSETGTFIRDLLTSKDGIVHPHGLCIHGNHLYVTQEENSCVKRFDIDGVEFESHRL